MSQYHHTVLRIRDFHRAVLDVAAANEDARKISSASAQLRKIVPNAGSYVSESNYFNSEWQRAYWGRNHERLRSVKQRYDSSSSCITA